MTDGAARGAWSRDVSTAAVLTGASAAVLGYASTAPVVVAGLTAVGASRPEVLSGVLVASLVMGAVGAALSARVLQPLVVVWSTPAAALLAGVGAVDGGFPAVVGAFAMVGVLVVLTGSLPVVARGLAAVPRALPSALCAGILLPICLRPVAVVSDVPLQAALLVGAWVVTARWAPRASAAVVLAVLALLALTGATSGSAVHAPMSWSVAVVGPRLSWDAVLSLALPLYVVTMTAQNLVGFSVLQTFGYRAPVRPVLRMTGVATALSAPFGAPPQNLAALTAALTAGPTAHAEPSRRWVAGVVAGGTCVVLAVASPVAVGLLAAVDPPLLGVALGLLLLPALLSSWRSASRDRSERVPVLVTLVFTASGLSPLGLGPATAGILAGGLVLALRRVRFSRQA